jgi:hypothetical protein
MTVDSVWRNALRRPLSRRMPLPRATELKIGTSDPRNSNHRCEPIDAMVQNRKVDRRTTGRHCNRGAVLPYNPRLISPSAFRVTLKS